MARICLLTPGQPSTNPRLVKEADALTEAGHEVRVLCAHWVSWASDTDRALLASRAWSCAYVGGHPSKERLRYGWTRLRQSVSRRGLAVWHGSSIVQGLAFCRVLPELQGTAKSTPADLYIAHNLGALAAAVVAAEKHSAYVGFDAEDFHSGEGARGIAGSVRDKVAEHFERSYLARCDYITAASPGIAEAYAARYAIPEPVPILNVFPLSQRPQEFRASRESGPLTLYWFSQTIGPDRGLEDIVQALGILRNQNIQLHLRGNWQPGYQSKLSTLAGSAGLDPKQIICHAPGRPEEMVRLSAQYDVGLALEQRVSKNRDICLTNKIFTYLLAGNAVVGTATTGQKPVMKSIGSAGFCYEPGNTRMLAEGLRLWVEDRRTLEQARRQAWEWGTLRYNWDLEKKRFLQVVEKVLPARSDKAFRESGFITSTAGSESHTPERR